MLTSKHTIESSTNKIEKTANNLRFYDRGIKKDVTVMNYDKSKGKWYCKFERGNSQWVDLSHYKFKILHTKAKWFHIVDADDDKPGRNNIFGDGDGNYATLRTCNNY